MRPVNLGSRYNNRTAARAALKSHQNVGPGHGRCTGHHLPVQLSRLRRRRVAVPEGAAGCRVYDARHDTAFTLAASSFKRYTVRSAAAS